MVTFWRVFWKTDACGQTVLPDRSILIGQKLVENAQIQNLKCDILSNFQTMCVLLSKKHNLFKHAAQHDEWFSYFELPFSL